MSKCLQQRSSRDVETALVIADNVRTALQVTKGCATEQQRQEYLIGLAYCAPPRCSERDRSGMIRRVAEFLGVQRGKRAAKRGGRPYAFDRAIRIRSKFDEAASKRFAPRLQGENQFSVGETVLTSNGKAELTKLTESGGCVVTYRVGSSYSAQEYQSCCGKQPGSARLQAVPPSLMPEPLAKSGLATSDATKKAVLDHAYTYCKVSPHQRDVAKRRRGPFVVEEKEGLILEDVRQAMHADFEKKHPSTLKYSKWKEVLKEVAWNIKKVRRCLAL